MSVPPPAPSQAHQHDNVYPPAPRTPTATGGTFLDLILNKGARQFWSRFVIDMRVQMHQLLDALDAWMLQGGVTGHDREMAVAKAGTQLHADHKGYISYGEFNKFTLPMMPWIPARVCDVILNGGSGDKPTREKSLSQEMVPPAPAKAEMSGAKWLQLIINCGARQFWADYIVEKSGATGEICDALEAWMMAECNIGREELHALIKVAREKLDDDGNGTVSYGEWNHFTLEMMPFSPERIKEVLLRYTLNPETVPSSPRSGFVAEVEAEVDAVTEDEAEEAAARPGSTEFQEEDVSDDEESGPSIDELMRQAEEQEAKELEEQEAAFQEPDTQMSVELVLNTAGAEAVAQTEAGVQQLERNYSRETPHVVPGSRWWQKCVNQVIVVRESQVHQPITTANAHGLIRLCQLNGGLPSKAKSAEVLQLARDLHVTGRQQGTMLSKAFENHLGHADMRQVATGLVFLCRKSFPETMAMSFLIFQDKRGTMTKEMYSTWVNALSKIAWVSAHGCCNVFNSICGGIYEPSYEKKHTGFNVEFMKAARQTVNHMENQLAVRFQANTATAAGMRRNTFVTWITSLASIKRWIIGLSEEWVNMVDHDDAFPTPWATLKMNLKDLQGHFASPKKERRITQMRVLECLAKMGLNDKATVLRILRLYDIDITQKYVLRRDILSGLSLVCYDSTGVLLNFVLGINKVDLQKESISVKGVYQGLRAFTVTALDVACALMENCSILDGNRRTQDKMARILNIRIGMYMNSLAHAIVEFVKGSHTDKLDFNDMGRMVEQQVGFNNWRKVVGTYMAMTLGVAVRQNHAPEAPHVVHLKKTGAFQELQSAATGDGADAAGIYSAANIRCVQPGSFWNLILVFTGTFVPRNVNRVGSVFDTMTDEHARHLASQEDSSQRNIDELLHAVNIRSVGISQDLTNMTESFAGNGPMFLGTATAFLLKMDSKRRYELIYEILTGTEPDRISHESNKRMVWEDICVFMATVQHVSEEVITHVTHRLHNICNGERKERRAEVIKQGVKMSTHEAKCTLHVRGIGKVRGGKLLQDAPLKKLFSKYGKCLHVSIRIREGAEVEGLKVNTSWALITMADEASVQSALRKPPTVGKVLLEVNPFSLAKAKASTGAMKQLFAAHEETVDNQDPLLQQTMASMRRHTVNTLGAMEKEFRHEIKTMSEASDVVQHQRDGTGTGLNQKEFVRWMNGKKGVTKIVDAWIHSLGNTWVQQLCEFEECSKEGNHVVMQPTSFQRLRAARLDNFFPQITAEAIHEALAISRANLVEVDELKMVLPDSEWLLSPSAITRSGQLTTALRSRLKLSTMSAERISLLLDDEGIGKISMRTTLAFIYALTGKTEAENVDRHIHLFQLEKEGIPLPERIYDMLRPYMMMALDSAEGMSFILSDMYGRDRASKHVILEYAHNSICDYADTVAGGLTSFLKQRAKGQKASITAIRRFLDDMYGFSGWVADVSNEWIMNADKFVNMKDGKVLRAELAKSMQVPNQFDHVMPESRWWKQVVLNLEFHKTAMSSHANWDGSMCDPRLAAVMFEMGNLWQLSGQSLDGSITVADAQESLVSAGLGHLDGIGNVIRTMMNSGRREVVVQWADFGCACMLLGNAAPRIKFQRMLQYLDGPKQDAKLSKQNIETLNSTIILVGMFNTRNLNWVVTKMCGGAFEPDSVSKTEQFQAMTLMATEKALTNRLRKCTDSLLKAAAKDGAVTADKIFKWVEDEVDFQKILKTTSVWMQHSVLTRCGGEDGGFVGAVGAKLSEKTIDVIRPIVDSYVELARAGPNFMLEMTKAMEMTASARALLTELLIDSHDGKIDVREGGVIFALLCGGSTAAEKFKYATELYNLVELKATDDKSNMSFIMQSYSMFRALWKVAMHVTSGFLSAYQYAIDDSSVLKHNLLKATHLRLGVYLDLIIKVFLAKADFNLENWQDTLNDACGHLKWLQVCCVAFANTLEGILTEQQEDTEIVTPSATALKAYGTTLEQHAPVEDDEDPELKAKLQEIEDTLRDELTELKPSVLKKRALSHSIEKEKLDQAADSDDPKEQLIELIVAVELPPLLQTSVDEEEE
eukprot:COSAG05_NODE_1006_length_6229_cov_614.704962_1_plen_2070_part_10